MNKMLAVAVVLAALLAACGEDIVSYTTTPADSGVVVEAGTVEADSGSTVQPQTDTGMVPDVNNVQPDAEMPDTGMVPDAGQPQVQCRLNSDCKPNYFCSQDGWCMEQAVNSYEDAGAPDVGQPVEAGTPDVGTPDMGVVPDAGQPDVHNCLPQPELCDGRDNDCDGQIDEDFPDKGKDCSVGVGECKRDGKKACTPDGKGLFCGAMSGQPSAEICDGKDNDCNGQVDEGGVCNKPDAGQPDVGQPDAGNSCIPSAEVCDGKDNDCDGQIDEQCSLGQARKCQNNGECTAAPWGQYCALNQDWRGYNNEAIGFCQTCLSGVQGGVDLGCTAAKPKCITNGMAMVEKSPYSTDGYLTFYRCGGCGGWWDCNWNEDCQNDTCVCIPNGVERCNGVDDDCDGQTDEDNVCASPDAGTDAGSPDTGFSDTGTPDAETDAGADTGYPDVGTTDSGSNDGGVQDAGPATCSYKLFYKTLGGATAPIITVRSCDGIHMQKFFNTSAVEYCFSDPNFLQCFQIDVDNNGDGKMEYPVGDRWGCNSNGRIDGELTIFFASTSLTVQAYSTGGDGNCRAY